MPEENQTKVAEPHNRAKFFPAIIIGGSILAAAIVISLGSWYQTRLMDSRLDQLEQLTTNIFERITSDPNDPLTAYKFSPEQNIGLTEAAISLGPNNAPVELVVFEDFQCPFCREFFNTVFPSLKVDYIDTGKLRFVHQSFAFLGSESVLAAEAARCANEQNSFWDYRSVLYKNQGPENAGTFTESSLTKFAEELSLNKPRFAACVSGRTYKTAVEQETESGRVYGVNATPTFFVNGRKLEGVFPYGDFKRIIDYALQKNN